MNRSPHSASRQDILPGCRFRNIFSAVILIVCTAAIAPMYPSPVAAQDSVVLPPIETAPAAEPPMEPAAAPDSSVWLVSTRCLGWPDACTAPALKTDGQFLRYNEKTCSWDDATAAEFYKTDNPQVPTLVFVHGYNMQWSDAFDRGWNVFNGLAMECRNKKTPTRYVIWSWPSNRNRGIIRDVRAKSARSDVDGLHLAVFLKDINKEVPVDLIGYSLGARIVTGSLHLLQGGELCGTTLPAKAQRPGFRARVQLLAAALPNDWLLPGRAHGRAITAAERLLVLFNPCDRALKRYRVVDPCCRPQALGATGIAGDWMLGDALQRIEEYDVSCILGKSHSIDGYLCSPSISQLMRNELWKKPVAKAISTLK